MVLLWGMSLKVRLGMEGMEEFLIDNRLSGFVIVKFYLSENKK